MQPPCAATHFERRSTTGTVHCVRRPSHSSETVVQAADRTHVVLLVLRWSGATYTPTVEVAHNSMQRTLEEELEVPLKRAGFRRIRDDWGHTVLLKGSAYRTRSAAVERMHEMLTTLHEALASAGLQFVGVPKRYDWGERKRQKTFGAIVRVAPQAANAPAPPPPAPPPAALPRKPAVQTTSRQMTWLVRIDTPVEAVLTVYGVGAAEDAWIRAQLASVGFAPPNGDALALTIRDGAGSVPQTRAKVVEKMEELQTMLGLRFSIPSAVTLSGQFGSIQVRIPVPPEAERVGASSDVLFTLHDMCNQDNKRAVRFMKARPTSSASKPRAYVFRTESLGVQHKVGFTLRSVVEHDTHGLRDGTFTDRGTLPVTIKVFAGYGNGEIDARREVELQTRLFCHLRREGFALVRSSGPMARIPKPYFAATIPRPSRDLFGMEHAGVPLHAYMARVADDEETPAEARAAIARLAGMVRSLATLLGHLQRTFALWHGDLHTGHVMVRETSGSPVCFLVGFGMSSYDPTRHAPIHNRRIYVSKRYVRSGGLTSTSHDLLMLLTDATESFARSGKWRASLWCAQIVLPFWRAFKAEMALRSWYGTNQVPEWSSYRAESVSDSAERRLGVAQSYRKNGRLHYRFGRVEYAHHLLYEAAMGVRYPPTEPEALVAYIDTDPYGRVSPDQVVGWDSRGILHGYGELATTFSP